ncbi:MULTISPECIES: Do family serine endopeptidase [Hyphomonas]|uniref:Probable periplasmic serine endoprotease DegP-like n=1 Tax=Hyphomonas adhaerens TaxID=81029 RepID=A0A3B9GX04_9PROT|nr:MULTISPECIES: Do family serine endopeptidase [Hyphomonas]MBB38962.1 Do family protease [Hyphomonas sp.]HAE26524.1 Do family protease [Hyphomonas adhaerens]
MRFPALAALALLVSVPLAAPAVAQQSLSRSVEGLDQRDRPASFRDLSKRLMPAVVNISTSKTVAPEGMPTFPEGSPMERFNDFFGRDEDGFRREGSLGSGFVISADGYVVTNNHVIDGADEIEVNFANGRVLDAELVGRDRDTDLAVLKVKSDTPLSYVSFADSDAAEVGDWVIAIGNPFGFGGSVSAGIISARNRDLNAGRSDDFIQTDAAINRGNSGGPLFNLGGEVIGVNTAIISPTGGSVGIGFSVPSNLVNRITDELIKSGRIRRSWLGVNVQDADEALVRAYRASGKGGVIVTRITDDGPADKAKLEVGDLILSFDGQPVASVRELTRVIADTPIDKSVPVRLVRDGRARTFTVTMGELQEETPEDTAQLPDLPASANDLGADLSSLDDDIRRRYGVPKDVEGVVVTSVSARGPAYGKLVRGDVIIEINFERVATVTDTLEKVKAARANPAEPLLVRVKRRGDAGWFDQFLSVDLGK